MIDKKEKIKNEREFICLLLKNKDLVGDWLTDGPKIEFFDEIHKVLLNAITLSYNNDVLLTRNTFIDFLDKFISSKQEKQAQELLYNTVNMMLVKRDDFPLLRGKIVEGFISRSSISFIDDFKDNIEAKGAVFAAKKLMQQMQVIVSDSVQQKPIIYESVSDYSQTYYDNLIKKRAKGPQEDGIKCFIKEIDETMSVGYAPGTLTLFCGDVGGFKSTMMLNVGSNVWELAGKNVLYVPLEMPREKMYQKFISRLLKVPFDRLEHPTLLNDIELKSLEKATDHIKTIEAKHNGAKFFIMEAPEQIPVSTIRREIERHIDIFKPNLVVIDYIANLVPDENTYRQDRNDLEIGNMLKALRTMGKPGAVWSEGFAIVSGAQVGREALKRVRKTGVGKASFHSEDIRGSHEYSADADTMYVQMEDPQQPGHRLWVFCVKSRYGNKNKMAGNSNKGTLELKPDISVIKSLDDSFYKVKHDEIMNKVNDASSLELVEDAITGTVSLEANTEFDKILGI